MGAEPSSQSNIAMRMMTYNVRMDTAADGIDKWDCRKEVVVGIINKYKPVVLGLQEPQKHQLDYLATALPRYSWVGAGRNSLDQLSDPTCEYNPIFYDPQALKLEASGTFWLSGTPEAPGSKMEGAAYPRVVTWIRAKHGSTGRTVAILNTHFDNIGEEARHASSKLLLKQLPEVAGGHAAAVVVMGDLNARPDSSCYKELAKVLQDVSGVAPTGEGWLPAGTSTRSGFADNTDVIIDYIFINDGFKATSYGVVNDKCPNGRNPSDHKPVVADLVLD